MTQRELIALTETVLYSLPAVQYVHDQLKPEHRTKEVIMDVLIYATQRACDLDVSLQRYPCLDHSEYLEQKIQRFHAEQIRNGFFIEHPFAEAVKNFNKNGQ